MNPTEQAQTLESLLQSSRAIPEFKTAVEALARKDARALDGRIRFNPGAPPVKVLRVIMKLLETRPEAAIESITLEGQSGCSDFRGRALIQLAPPAALELNFTWDCAWRARREGWSDPFGDPDQIRAAQSFGYQCFETFDLRDAKAPVTP